MADISSAPVATNPSPDVQPQTPNASQVTEAKTNVGEAGNIPEKETPEVDVETLIPTDSYQTDPLFYQVADYFNIDPAEYPLAKDKLSEIVDFAIRETKSNDPAVLLKKIRELEDTVQPPAWGEKRYWNIQKYIRLASRKTAVEKAMQAFERKK